MGEGSLGLRARQSVFWNTGMSAITSMGQFGLMLVLVRLLDPETYGQYGLLMAVIGFVFVFSAQGTIDYVLQVRDESEMPVSEIFFFAVAISFLLCMVTNLVAMAMHFFPKYSEIAPLLHLVSLTFFLHPARALRAAMLQRALEWKRIRILHLTGFVTSALAAVYLAYSGAGVYALIVSTFVVPLPYIVDLLVVARWRPRLQWHFSKFKPALIFGLNRQLSSAMAAGRRLLESTLMVQLLGFASFGAYGRAVSLSDVVCTRLTGQALEALYPAITKLEIESDRYRRASGLVLRTCVWSIAPIAALMGILSEPLVNVVLGKNWSMVVPLLPWVLALGCSSAIFHTLYRLLLGHAQERHCLYLDSMVLVGIVSSLMILLPLGLTSYLQGAVAVHVVAIAVASYCLSVRRGISTESLAASFVAPLFPLGAAGIACVQIGAAIDGFAPIMVRAPAQIVVFLGIYAALIRVLYARHLIEIVPYLPMQRPVRRLLALG